MRARTPSFTDSSVHSARWVSHIGLYALLLSGCAVGFGTPLSTLKGEISKWFSRSDNRELLMPCHWLLASGVIPLMKAASDSRAQPLSSPLALAMSAQPPEGTAFIAGAYVTFSTAAAISLPVSNET